MVILTKKGANQSSDEI